MQKVIFETLSETDQLAKQLAGKRVNETVKNIKDFIYWHIQYLQDETEQKLHSPAHAWSIRSTGVDCKSYSIFASSLLTNLGITNSLRQIKQLAFNPEYWSHVYVFLPNHNLVIDGTVRYDHEPQFAEKYDKPILQNGLKGLGHHDKNRYQNKDLSQLRYNIYSQSLSKSLLDNESIPKLQIQKTLPVAAWQDVTIVF